MRIYKVCSKFILIKITQGGTGAFLSYIKIPLFVFTQEVQLLISSPKGIRLKAIHD
jgi:hypothetical protein